MATFVALVHKDPDSCFGVSFPDFPGCVSAGDTLDEAVAMAHEALSGHVAVIHEYGDPIPVRAKTVDEIMAEERDGGIPVLVTVEIPGRSIRVNVSMEERLVERIDRAAASRGMSRSAFLADAAKRVLAAG